jgi:hypothetical protein
VQNYLNTSWAQVAYVYNPSYSGGRDKEEHGLKLAPNKYVSRPYCENTLHNKQTNKQKSAWPDASGSHL